jgi:hypothetical protein
LRISLSVSFGLDFANDDVGFANLQQVEFEAEAFAIFIGLGCANLGPVAGVLSGLADDVDAVRRLLRFLDDRGLSFRL